jgi:hypothetical protein
MISNFARAFRLVDHCPVSFGFAIRLKISHRCFMPA